MRQRALVFATVAIGVVEQGSLKFIFLQGSCVAAIVAAARWLYLYAE